MADIFLQDSRYSWFRLSVSLVMAVIGGLGLWLPVIILPFIQQEFGVDRAGASLPYTGTMLGFAIGSLVMGWLSDRFGILLPMVCGAIALTLGFFMAALAPDYKTYILAQAVPIGLLGSAPTFGPLVADISLWFRRSRGLAVAIVASGNYIAGALWPVVITWIAQTQGWRTAYWVVGGLTLLIMLPLSFLLKRRAPHMEAQSLSGATHVLQGTGNNFLQVMVVLAGFACCVAMSMPQVHIVAYCGDLGYGVGAGARMLLLMLGCGVVSRLVSGLVADKIGGTGTLIIGSVLQCLALLFYIPFDGLTSLYIVSAFFGLSQGGIVPSYALIIRDHFSAREAGFRISLVLTATVLGMAAGGWLSGEIFDHTGSYRLAFLHGVAWNLLNMAIAVWLLLGRFGPKRTASLLARAA